MVIRRSFWTLAALLLTVGLCIPFFSWVLPATRAFPYSDEWHYLVPMTAPGAPHLSWLFAQHVDHRIPFQKAIHFWALRATHFDFRVLVAINMLTAAVGSIFAVMAARVRRGESSIGDLFIPLCLLSLGMGYTQWGFEFQFLSSVVLFAAFLFFTARGSLTAALVALLLCSWAGLNGMIVSTFISGATGVYLIVMRRNPGRLFIAVLALAFLQNIALWLAWVPSEVSGERATLGAILQFVAGMTNGPLIVYVFRHPEWKLAILLALIAGGAASAAFKTWKSRSIEDFMVLAAIGAAMALTLATAYGRAKEMAWVSGLEIHYGEIASMMPIAAWIALSATLPRRWRAVAGIVLVALFAKAYWANYQWRESVVANDLPLNRSAADAILSSRDAAQVSASYMPRFFFVDTPATRAVVTGGISILRAQR